MTNYLDLQSWPRRKHFDFFRTYDNPFFNLCANVEVTELRTFAKDNNVSFFIASLFFSTKAANAIEPFRYRLREDRVLVHETIHPGSTILNEDDTFGFCYFTWTPDFRDFAAATAKALDQYHNLTDKLNPQEARDDLIHYSVIPWVSFTSFSHARKFRKQDSVPKIVFGKYLEENGSLKLPVSVEVHHSLMDGIQVGEYYDQFQCYAADPQKYLGDERHSFSN